MVALVCLSSPWWAPAAARGNGAFPDGGSIILRPDRPNEIIVVTNFGLVISDDGGASWEFTCEDLDNVRNLWRYSVEAAPHQRIYAVGQRPDQFWGLAMSDDEGCAWTTPSTGMEFLDMQDFFLDPTAAGRVLALAKWQNGGSLVYGFFESRDGGRTFGAPVRNAPVGSSFDSVEVARTDPGRIYLVARANSVEFAVEVSDDGGRSWHSHALPAGWGEEFYIVAVDPNDRDRLLVRGIGYVGNEPRDRLFLSGDAGKTWATALDLAGGSPSGRFTAFLRRADGTLLLAGQSSDGRGLGWRSSDRGATWQSWDVGNAHLRGLGERAGVLHAVGDQRIDGFALGRRTDPGGEGAWEPVLRYERIRRIRPCARQRCAGNCRTLAATFGIFPPTVCEGDGQVIDSDGGSRPSGGRDAAAGAGGPPGGGGCGCSTGPGPRPSGIAIIAALVLLVAAAWRRRSIRAAVLALLAAGCATEGTGNAPGDGGAGGSVPTFAQVSAALRPRCDPCHTEEMFGLMNIGVSAADDARAHQSLMAATMGQHCGGMGRVRVVPRNPESSVLYQKVLARSTMQETAPCGAGMPPPGLEPLSREQVEMIRAWIAGGAPGP